MFSIGNVVSLNSSRVPMTIVEQIDNEFVICAWFDKKGNIDKAKFHVNSLRIIDETNIQTDGS